MAEVKAAPLNLVKRSLGAAFLVLGTAILGVGPTYYWAGNEGLLALGLAAVICWLAAMAALIPIHWAATRGLSLMAWACLLAIGLRLLTTMVLGLATYFISHVSLVKLSIWILIFYLILLFWETVVVLHVARNHMRQTGCIQA